MSQHAPTEQHGTASGQTFSATVEAAPLRAVLDAVDAVVDECVLQVRPDGLAVDAQDPATVAMVSLDLPASAFEAYDASGAALGVDLDRLGGVVGMADRDEPVRLALDPETRTLQVGIGELSYTLGLLDPDAIRSPPEEIDVSEQFTATVAIEGRAVVHAVRAADMVADHLALGVDADEEVLYAGAEGDVDSVRVEHPAAECAAFDAGEAHSLFSVSYLDAIAGIVPPDAEVRVRLGEEAPLELSFGLAGGSVRYLVAPRRRVR